MGATINSRYHEAAPVISPDGKTLYFFVVNHPENTYGKEGTEDIWKTVKDEKGVWGKPVHLGAPFNQHRSNSVYTVLPDGSLFIRGGKAKNSPGFSIVSSGGSIRELKVKDFESLSKGRFNGATLSNDGRHMVLYFSEREKAIPSDLYVSHQQGDGTFSRPEKLKLSSAADETGPFISPDQKTLYFSSDRPATGRKGKLDVYKATRLDDTWNNWSDPVNLGAPVNTAGDDMYFSIESSGNIFTARAVGQADGGTLDLLMLVMKDVKIMLNGIVLDETNRHGIPASVEIRYKSFPSKTMKTSTNGKFESRLQEVNQYGIYAQAGGFEPREVMFTLPKVNRDTTVNVEVPLTPVARPLFLSGNVYDKKTSKPVTANVTISFPATAMTFTVAAEGGKYNQQISDLGLYRLTASAEGYLSGSDSVRAVSAEGSPFTRDLYLTPIEVGLTVRLNNIYFDYDKTTLKPESFVELDKVVDFLTTNGTVEIEIAGHTDDRGSDVYNQTLSQGRSQAVVDYIVSQGIDVSRLAAKGYGESKPVDTNSTDAGRAVNRRVEFTVLKK
jgi:outer membrane protein OmpA-like peptidoglycan-associated protein